MEVGILSAMIVGRRDTGDKRLRFHLPDRPITLLSRKTGQQEHRPHQHK
jgi:hypothetical protein